MGVEILKSNKVHPSIIKKCPTQLREVNSEVKAFCLCKKNKQLKSCHSFQFIAISQYSVIITEHLWTANNNLFTSCLRVAFSIEWLLTPNPAWGGSPGLSIYICINILILYLILTICTHEHYPIGSSQPQTQVYKRLFTALFSQFLDFSPYEQHIFIHDKSALCFLGLVDWSIHKQCKTQASWGSAPDSYGEKSLPALQPHFFIKY